MISNIFKKLAAKIEAERALISLSISEGACNSYEHYRDNCGYVRGLNAALIMMEELEREND